MRLIKSIATCTLAASLMGGMVGCSSMKKNARTTGTIGGAAVGAAAGAAIDDDKPVRGAIIGGVIGGAAGNVGGKIYKDNR